MTIIVKNKVLTVTNVVNIGKFSEAQHHKCYNQFITTNL